MFGNVLKGPEQSRADWCVEECRMLECCDVLGTVGTPGSHRPHVAANTGYYGHSGHGLGTLHHTDGVLHKID